MKKLYLVSEIHYEYNDEIYHNDGSGSGTPVSLYTSKQSADKVVIAKTLKTIETLEIINYCYDLYDVINIDYLNMLLGQANLTQVINHDDYEEVEERFKTLLTEAIHNVNEGLVDQLINKVLRIKFFKVQEVELEQ